MTLWTVELTTDAYLRGTAQVEADTREEAFQKAYALDDAAVEEACEGEKYHLTGEVTIDDIYPDEDEEDD